METIVKTDHALRQDNPPKPERGKKGGCSNVRSTHLGELSATCGLTTQAQRRRPRGGFQLRRPAAVRWSAWLGRVRNLIHALQEYIRVTEIREDTTSTLR